MKFSLMAKRMAVIPAHSASRVRIFGTIRLIDSPDSRRTSIRARRRLERTLIAPSFRAGGAACRSARSLGNALAGHFLSHAVGDHRFAAHHPLSLDHHCDIRGWTIDVDPRAKADDADPLTCRNLLSLTQVAHDAPGDEAGHLHEGDLR